MSKLTEQFRLLSIYNSHDFAKVNGSPVFISYSGGDTWHTAKWTCYRVGFKTDKDNSFWQDRGQKTFNVYNREQKASQLKAAQDWASAKYGVKEWAKTPYGDYMDAEFVKSRVKELKAKVKELEIKGDD